MLAVRLPQNAGKVRLPSSLVQDYAASRRCCNLLLIDIAVESYRQGYPRFSALIGSHESFHACRRFSSLRARLLLQKQDALSLLEKKLDAVDEAEQHPFYLSKTRLDGSQERGEILTEIDQRMADYGM